MTPDYLDCLISEKEAAAFLSYSVRALQNWRCRGGGPEFIRVSIRSIRYRRRELIAWVESNRVSIPTTGEGSRFQKTSFAHGG